jgi:hypothetical protein
MSVGLGLRGFLDSCKWFGRRIEESSGQESEKRLFPRSEQSQSVNSVIGDTNEEAVHFTEGSEGRYADHFWTQRRFRVIDCVGCRALPPALRWG